MKKTNKKGFTIVELVIVIAVIGILAAILIPTFVNLTENARASALQSNLRNAYIAYAADAELDGQNDEFGGKLVVKGIDEVMLVDTELTSTAGATTKGYVWNATEEKWEENTLVKLTEQTEKNGVAADEDNLVLIGSGTVAPAPVSTAAQNSYYNTYYVYYRLVIHHVAA